MGSVQPLNLHAGHARQGTSRPLTLRLSFDSAVWELNGKLGMAAGMSQEMQRAIQEMPQLHLCSVQSFVERLCSQNET